MYKCHERQESWRPDTKHEGNWSIFPANWQVDIFTYRHLIKRKVDGRGSLKIFLHALSPPFPSSPLFSLVVSLARAFFRSSPTTESLEQAMFYLKHGWSLKLLLRTYFKHFNTVQYFSITHLNRHTLRCWILPQKRKPPPTAWQSSITRWFKHVHGKWLLLWQGRTPKTFFNNTKVLVSTTLLFSYSTTQR